MLRILITTAGKGKKWRFYPSRSCHKYGYITNSYTEFLPLLFYIFLMRASHRGEEIERVSPIQIVAKLFLPLL